MGFFNFLKYILLLVSFMFTFYIILSMYERLEKSIVEAFSTFIPYLVLFLLMSFNMIFRQKQVTDNLFFNLTACLVFGVFVFVGYRALMDEALVTRYLTDYNIAFQYFSDMVAPLNAMLYLLIASDIFLIFSKNKDEKIKEFKEEEKHEKVVSKRVQRKAAYSFLFS